MAALKFLCCVAQRSPSQDDPHQQLGGGLILHSTRPQLSLPAPKPPLAARPQAMLAEKSPTVLDTKIAPRKGSEGLPSPDGPAQSRELF